MLCCCLATQPHATPIVSITCISIDHVESREVWRQVEDFLIGSETVVRMEGTLQTLMHSMYTFTCMANKI